MKLQVRVVGACLAIAVAAMLSSPASSFGAVECKNSGPDRVLEINAVDASTTIRRSGDQIVVSTSTGPVNCTGAPATVTDIDRVRVTHAGRRGDVLQLAGGPFAPGSLAEPTGLPEIEFEYVGPTFLSVIGTAGPDRLGWGRGGSLNLNGDDDVDVAGSFTVVIVQGGRGRDVIAPRADYRSSAARLIATGGRGKDTITAPRDGGVVHGGADRDRLRGGPGSDNLTGGRGRDVIGAGKGRDLIRALDNTRDRVNCGGGVDRVKADGIDRLRNCERRILVKQRGPARG